MKETGITYISDMARKVRRGEKTQTRRIIKPQPPIFLSAPPNEPWNIYDDIWTFAPQSLPRVARTTDTIRCPYGKPGDMLYLKEPFCFDAAEDEFTPKEMLSRGGPLFYLLDGTKPEGFGRTRSARFMPKDLARIWLRILDIRIQQLQNISEEDAKAEGAEMEIVLPGDRGSYVAGFMMLWDSINYKLGHEWDLNEWVWRIEFERIER